MKNAIQFIREDLFKVSQAEFARMIDVTQQSVSFWETVSCNPRLDVLRRIRAVAKQKHLPFRAHWLFINPKTGEPWPE